MSSLLLLSSVDFGGLWRHNNGLLGMLCLQLLLDLLVQTPVYPLQLLRTLRYIKEELSFVLVPFIVIACCRDVRLRTAEIVIACIFIRQVHRAVFYMRRRSPFLLFGLGSDLSKGYSRMLI